MKREDDETHVSTEHQTPIQEAWLPPANVGSSGAERAPKPTSQGTQAPQRVIEPLSRRTDFDQLRRRGVRRTSGPIMATVLMMHCEESAPPVTRLAFALPRSFGSAVQRNRVRRRCRAALQQIDGTTGLPGGSVLIRCHRVALDLSFADLRSHLAEVVR